MKILNIILCVLILLLAAASAAASYLLYEKRVQMVSGWSKMATAINQTAIKLEEKSGRKISGELSVDELSHLKYDELDAKLEKLQKHAADLVRQRNALAIALQQAGRNAEMANLPSEEQLFAFATSKTAGEGVVASVSKLRGRRDQLANLIAQSARRVNVTLSSKDLRHGDARAAISKFDERVKGIQAQFDAYRNALSRISQLAGGSAVTLTDQNFAQELTKVAQAVNSLREQYDNAMANAKNEQSKRLRTERTVQQRDGAIKVLRLNIASKDDEIAQYRRALGVSSGFQAWKNGSAECRRAVRGKVVAVNEKFGYIGIDLGSDTMVRQSLGGRVVEVNPEIKAGMSMYVARATGAEGALDYVGKVKLTAVDTDTSIAESQELAPDHKIQVGDVVFMEEGIPAPLKAAGK